MIDYIVYVFLVIFFLYFGTYWIYRYLVLVNEELGCQEYISGEYINVFILSKRVFESVIKYKICKSIIMFIIREEFFFFNKEVNSYKFNNLF